MADEYALKTDTPPRKGISKNNLPEPVPVLRPGVRPRRGFAGHCLETFFCLLPISLFGAICGMVFAVQRPPEFYSAAVQALPSPERRQVLAQEVDQKQQALQAVPATQQEWSLELTEEQINSWLAERFGKSDWEGLPQISDPRVQIQPGLLQMGVKSLQQNSVLSFDVRPTVSGPRQVTLKIEAIRSGVVPLPVSQIELPATGAINGEGWELRWKHDPAQQTIVLDWDAGQRAVFSDWKMIELQNKHLAIRGKLPVAESPMTTASSAPEEKTKPPATDQPAPMAKEQDASPEKP